MLPSTIPNVSGMSQWHQYVVCQPAPTPYRAGVESPSLPDGLCSCHEEHRTRWDSSAPCAHPNPLSEKPPSELRSMAPIHSTDSVNHNGYKRRSRASCSCLSKTSRRSRASCSCLSKISRAVLHRCLDANVETYVSVEREQCPYGQTWLASQRVDSLSSFPFQCGDIVCRCNPYGQPSSRRRGRRR